MILTSIIQIEFLFYPARDLMQKMGKKKPYLTEQASDSSVMQGGENPATFSKQPWRNRIKEWKKRLSV
ncbi:hypothetical protein POTOM_017528 [Populus tomentosa]|uniref:Uncharacterized protein n=1 Tax=Populus tomentosa TaxID=118781 RepID=A0A8X8D487_POPTO|nr:hypothetical protein POTOM_017528 [Populus tomentosa]